MDVTGPRDLNSDPTGESRAMPGPRPGWRSDSAAVGLTKGGEGVGERRDDEAASLAPVYVMPCLRLVISPQV